MLNRAIVRLLTFNDVFGDNQLREVILDELNQARRRLNGKSPVVIIDLPFEALLKRVTQDEPMAVAIRFEREYIRKALHNVVAERAQKTPR